MIDGKDYVSRARLELRAATNYLEVETIRAGGKPAASEYLARVYPTVDGRKRRGAAARLAKACKSWDMSKGSAYTVGGMVMGCWIVWHNITANRRGDADAYVGPRYIPLCPTDWDEGRPGK